MTDPVTAARSARENLARGLAILQSPGVPPHLLDVAEPVAQAMGALHRIEASAGAASVEQAPLALDAVRRALSQLQASSGAHPAVDQAMEAVAGSLGLVHSLTQVPAAAPAPALVPDMGLGGTVAMSSGAQQPAAPYQQPAPAPQPAAQPAPPYQQPAAQYQQPVPQAAPQYQQPAPQAAPQYQQPAPQAAPQYQQPAPQAAPAQAYQQPYAAPQQAYPAQPQPGYAQPPQQAASPYGPPPAAAAPPWGQQPAQPPAGSWPQHAVPQQQAPSAPAHPAPAPPGAAPGVAVPPGTPRVEADLGAHSPSNFYKGLSGNDVIECGGIFVATYQIPKIGTNLALKVSLPGGYEFEALGVVEWVREAPNSASAGMEAPPGFGAKFTQISPEGRQLVYRYVRNREPLFHDDL